MKTEGGSVRTTCPYCGVGCGVIATSRSDGTVDIKGDPEHPANFGRLCSKGSALGETLALEGRLLHPEIGDRRAGWDEALGLVARRFSRAIAEHGPDSVAFYVSGQLLTEDYYVANKLMKGFIGSANIDTNSRLCMASSVAGHRRAFGSDTVPGTYEDLELADLVVLVGSNLAWCHPVLYQRLAAAKEKRPDMKVVLVDPRATATSAIADLHLSIVADGDVALFCGLLRHLAEEGRLNESYTERHTTGLDAALAAAAPVTVERVAGLTGLGQAEIAEFYRLFGRTDRVVTVFSQGVNQSATGTDKVNAIINCHLATGRIGRPGMGPFSVTGQPNAMGGREVGGLANMLAAHMEIEKAEDRALVRDFWQSPTIAERPGLKAVDMFRAVADGRIKALWIMATNPVDSMPEADAVHAAIAACPFVVASDVLRETDTTALAHVRLPAAAWGEKDGTVTNSERRISRQRPFLPLPGEARPDWWIVGEVARRMGFGEAFAYTSPAGIFAEHAALSGHENDGSRDFDIGACAGIGAEEYEALQPFQWPAPALPSPLRGGSLREAKRGGGGEASTDRAAEPPPTVRSAGTSPTRGEEGAKRFFASGNFYTTDRKARFIPVSPPARRAIDADYPFILNTGRVRDHWHTMTRTGKSARLSAHIAEPYAELHPLDAARLGIGEADIVRLRSPHGEVLLRVLVSGRQRLDSVFVPMHWNDLFAGRARVDTLVTPATDPFSGQPAMKSTPVRVERFTASVFAYAVMREKPRTVEADYWALARCEGGWRLELAFAEAPADWATFARSLFGADEMHDQVAYRDSEAGAVRLASFAGERLIGAFYAAPEPVEVSRNWAVEQLAAAHARDRRLAVIAGRTAGSQPDKGAIVCSCFGVGANEIAAAVTAGSHSVAAIGTALQAGTNCGSCRSEIKGLIDAHRLEAAE